MLSSDPLQQNITECELISSKISSYFSQAAEQYHRLIFAIAQPTPEISFQQVAQLANSRYINVNLELSRVLLEFTQRQKPLKAQKLLEDIVASTDEGVIFLEHLEILFDNSLKLDPLRCLQKLSRNRTIVAVWSGNIENEYLIYAEPGHPEYRRYSTKDLFVVNIEQPEADPS